MIHTDKFLQMLESPEASVRHAACEELRVSIALTNADILALTRALNYPDRIVREAAEAALQAHEKTMLADDDTRVATGGLWRRAAEAFGGQASLLIRSGDGSYHMLDRGGNEKTAISGVLPEIERVMVSRDTTRDYIGLATEAGFFYFQPWDVYIAQEPNQPSPAPAEFLLNSIKASGKTTLVQHCPLCEAIRPADEPRCSNPNCAEVLASIQRSKEGAAAARGGWFVGGLAGIVLFVIVFAITWIFDYPQELRAKIVRYWWGFPLAVGLLVSIGFTMIASKETGVQK